MTANGASEAVRRLAYRADLWLWQHANTLWWRVPRGYRRWFMEPARPEGGAR